MADIVAVGLRMSGQNLLHAGRQPDRPSSGLQRAGDWLALSHIDVGRLSLWRRIVTVVREQRVDLRLHRSIHLDERRPGAFEAFARNFLRRVDAEFAAF